MSLGQGSFSWQIQRIPGLVTSLEDAPQPSGSLGPRIAPWYAFPQHLCHTAMSPAPAPEATNPQVSRLQAFPGGVLGMLGA